MVAVETWETAGAPPGALAAVRSLLDAAFAGDLTEDDWAHTVGGHHVVVRDGGLVVAHAAVVARTLEAGDRLLCTGYVEGVATAPDRQGEGLGSRAMLHAADAIRRRFDMGALSTGRHGFYARLGWQRWRGPTFVRHGDRRVRSAEDDDGVMVLCFGPSADVDRSAALTCAARPGDAW